MRELRYAIRLILKSPGASLVAILSLALGMGANTTLFSFADALVLQKPHIAVPSQVVEIYVHDPDPNVPLGGNFPFSYLDYVTYRDQNRSLAGLTLYSPNSEASVSLGGEPATWNGQLAAANFFDVLGVHPVLGRGFLPQEGATPGSSAVVVISYSAWQSHFGGARDVVGRSVTMNGQAFTIVGVAPRSFTGLIAGLQTDYWVPMTMAERMGNASALTNRGSRSAFAVGRLRPGVTPSQAAADLSLIQAGLNQQFPKDEGRGWTARANPIGVEPALARGFIGNGTALLAVVVGLVLLIAAANAALVLLVESLARRREWALRSALGASPGRLLRQGLTHSILLALIASGLGLVMAQALGPMLLRLAPAGFPVELDFSLNLRVLLFTLVLGLITGLAFGLTPAWQGARVQVLDNLKDGTPGAGGRRSLARSFFVIGQVALCVVVLVGALLCVRSLEHAGTINPGFDTQHLITVNIDPQGLGLQGDQAAAFMERLRTAAAGLAGVQAASWITTPPLQLSISGTTVLPSGWQPPPHKTGYDVDDTTVGAGYFAASGTRLLAGRDFTAADAAQSGQAFVVINATLARKFWPQGDALGHALLFPGARAGQPTSAQIVGIAEDGKYFSLGESPTPYLFLLRRIQTPATLMVRVAGAPAAFLPGLRHAIEPLDANLSGQDILTIQQYMATPLFPARFTGILLSGFGVLALLLAVIGLYGVIAAVVQQRTREYGIRMALGANGATLLRLVVGQGLKLALIGVVLGVAAAALLTRLMSGLLYGLSTLDPLSYLAAAAVLAAVAAVASYIPARRATTVDPLIALRYE